MRATWCLNCARPSPHFLASPYFLPSGHSNHKPSKLTPDPKTIRVADLPNWIKSDIIYQTFDFFDVP